MRKRNFIIDFGDVDYIVRGERWKKAIPYIKKKYGMKWNGGQELNDYAPLRYVYNHYLSEKTLKNGKDTLLTCDNLNHLDMSMVDGITSYSSIFVGEKLALI